MKEFIMQETEEMTTFGSVWKRYEPVAELVRCKNCAYAFFKEGLVQHGYIFCTKPFTERWQAVKPDNWFCADGERA